MSSGSVTTVIAVWGAVLSTFVVARDYWRSRRRARVRVAYRARPVGPSQQPFVLTATIANHGREPIHVGRAAVRTDRVTMATEIFVSAPPLPVELKPGQSFAADFRAEEVWGLSASGDFREVRVVFFDQLGREFVSDPTPVGEPRPTKNGWSLDPVAAPTFMERVRARFRNTVRRRSLERDPLGGHRDQS